MQNTPRGYKKFEGTDRVMRQDFVDIVMAMDTDNTAQDSMIKSITGKTNASTIPAVTLEVLSTQYWKASTVYALGTIIRSPAITHSYKYFECTKAGTSGTAEPTWGAVGTTVTDGTVVWTIRDIRDSRNYGLGAYCTSVNDANNAVLSGFYKILGSASGGLNIPSATGTSTAYIFVEAMDNLNIKQQLFSRAGGLFYGRQMMNGTWLDWVQIPTMDLVLPLTGGNMKGAINEASVIMASASTMAIGAAAGNFIIVTGAVTINAFDVAQAGTRKTLRFSSALTITHTVGTINLPSTANITVAGGDTMEFISVGSYWVCTDYQPVAGYAPAGLGIGGSVKNISSVSIKSVTTGGRYYCSSCTDTPVALDGYLDVIMANSSYMLHRYTVHNGATYEKKMVGGVWDSAWKQLATTDKIDMLGDLTFDNNKILRAKDTSGVARWLAGISSDNQFYLGNESIYTVLQSKMAIQAIIQGTTKTIATTDQIPTTPAQVGAAPDGYGLGSSAANITGTDLNNLKGNGFFIGNNLKHSPNGLEWTSIISVSNGTDVLTQYAHDTYMSQSMYIRYSADYGATWSPWRRLATTDQTTYIVASGRGTGYYWRKWSNGDIEQWGVANGYSNNLFPIAFPTACTQIVITGSVEWNLVDKTQFYLGDTNISDSGKPATRTYMAIGN